jgi:hypothetical protein
MKRLLLLLYLILTCSCVAASPRVERPDMSASADPDVQNYLYIAGVLEQLPNEAIVDVSEEDYVDTLTPEQLDDAQMEVAIMRRSTSGPSWMFNQVLVGEFRDRRGVERSAQANADAALSAAGSAQANADAALSAAGSAQTSLALRRHASLRATGLSSLSASSGSGTLVPWPGGSIQSSETDASGDWSLSGGSLHCDEPGLYRVSFAVSFTSGALTTGLFTFTVGGAPFPVQHALLATGNGVSGTALVEVPGGGGDLEVRVVHSGTPTVTIGSMRLHVERVLP